MKANKLFLMTILMCLSLYALAQETVTNNSTQYALNDTILISKDDHGFNVSKRKFAQSIGAFMVSPLGDYEVFIFSRAKNGKVSNKYRIEIYRSGEDSKLWEKNFNAATCSFRMTPFGILEVNRGKIQMLRYSSGTPLWTTSTNSYCGCVGDMFITRDMFGGIHSYSLQTGEKLWNTSISHNGGLCYSQILDETHDFLVADNIYKIDWTNGETKHLKAKTYIKDKGAIALTALMALGTAVASAGMGGGFYYYSYPVYTQSNSAANLREGLTMSPTSGYNIFGIASGIVQDNGRNYFADRNSVTCFDDDLNVIWRTEVEDEKNTRSVLILTDEKLYVISLGYAIKGGMLKDLAAPSVSAYSTVDGKHLFTEKLRDDKKHIRDDYGEGDYFYMMFDDAISVLNTADNKVSRVEYDATKYGSLISFVSGDDCIVKADGAFFQPLKSVAKDIPMATNNGYVIEMSRETGNVKPICNRTSFYRVIDELNGHILMRGGYDNREIWSIRDSKAVMLTDDAKKVWVHDNRVFYMNTAGEIICFEIISK